MSKLSRILGAVTLTGVSAISSNAQACGGAPLADGNKDRPDVYVSVYDGKMSLSMGEWYIAAGNNGKLSVTSMTKCLKPAGEYEKAERQMKDLAKDVCSPAVNVKAILESGSSNPTKAQLDAFCAGLK